MQIKSEKKFGKQVLGDFFLEDGYVSLNHGSYGTYPKVIRPVLHDLQLKAEVNPDRWLRRDMFAEMDKNKQAVSALLHCSPDELVFVTNAMTGINTVLRSIPLSPGDKIICVSFNFFVRIYVFLTNI
jgi:selenocysteine lyase/cysteine desulfurase